MKKLFAGIAICVILVMCLVSPASAALTNQWYGGDRVVYDTTNDAYWYPYLTDTLDMTRAGQEGFIAGINAGSYGGMKNWQMATSEQTQALKDSLAEMGKYRVDHSWPWTPPGSPRNMGSPFLAWPIQIDKFFTPTSVMTQPLQMIPLPILGGHAMQVFNGRTTGQWWRTDVPTTPYSWEDGEADDHFVVSAYMTPGKYSTMTFNYDVHLLPDDATTRNTFPGPFGVWIISTSQPVPEPGALLLGSMGVAVVGWLRRRKTL